MLRFLLLAVLAVLVVRAVSRLFGGVIAAAGGGRRPAKQMQLVRDPVCGTYVASGSSLSLTRGGTTHYFCSERCQKAYKDQRGGERHLSRATDEQAG